ncbi:hypothetical protein GCM10011329_29070 [Stakelama pacifica]|nr:hypothetical protein GCM10011329_29070 [Stakelama pacifica]
MDGRVGRFARIDIELAEQIVQPQPVDHRADSDTHRAIGIMGAYGDDRAFESGIADPRHREEKLAG